MSLIKRILVFVFGVIGLFCIGYLFGMHHRLVAALIQGEKLPEAPKECPFG